MSNGLLIFPPIPAGSPKINTSLVSEAEEMKQKALGEQGGPPQNKGCFKDGTEDTTKKEKKHKTGTNKIHPGKKKKMKYCREGEGKHVLVIKLLLK